MAGVLSFSDYIGGPDEVIAKQVFPSDQTSYNYNFGVNITGWTFAADYQTIVVDHIAFNRYTGEPNFSNSTVIGSFPLGEITGNSAPAVGNAAAGTMTLKIPAGLYDGPIIPDARANVPVTVVSLTWTTADTFPITQSHRWAMIQCWEPDVEIADPTGNVNYTPLA